MFLRDNNLPFDYLRISVTDRCNQRCLYCMPEEGIEHQSHDDILSFEEMLRLTRIFVSLGVRKLRLTGGEPLVRKGIIDLIRKFASIPALEEICLTTNAVLLSTYAEELYSAGVKKINISLDTLNIETFKKITRFNLLKNVLQGIEKAKKMNFHALKLNTVIMKGINDHEILDFIDFARHNTLTLRFIEFMKVTPLWEERFFLPLDEIKNICSSKYRLTRLGHFGSAPAEYYRIGNEEIIGFIKTDQTICGSCSRLRLTSTGELKICLYETRGLDCKELMRDGIDDKRLSAVIADRILMKKNINYKKYSRQDQYMCAIGG